MQFRAKVRGQQSFQGRVTGPRNKFSSLCFREEVLKLLFLLGNLGNQVTEARRLFKGFPESPFILFRKSQLWDKKGEQIISIVQ